VPTIDDDGNDYFFEDESEFEEDEDIEDLFEDDEDFFEEDRYDSGIL